jgi:hypothetical protein
MSFHFGRRRRGGPFSLVAFLLAVLVTGGWSFFQAHRFSSACKSIVEGQTLAEAEGALQLRRGRRVAYGTPRADAVTYQFSTFGSGERICELVHAEGLVVSASARSR